jgi:transcriptional regulator with GAF, ATPase, and Fis domain
VPGKPLTARILARSIKKTGYSWPGNVRELEQAVRRTLLTRHYLGDEKSTFLPAPGGFVHSVERGNLTAKELLAQYCTMLHQRFGSYEEVARRDDLDRRTVKKYVREHQS